MRNRVDGVARQTEKEEKRAGGRVEGRMNNTVEEEGRGRGTQKGRGKTGKF